jgi:serine/threonine protein kinase/Tfp pilus assembly protein PilF
MPNDLGDSMIGKTLSHFKILEQIGEGGMGAVYKAEDTNLHRQVALKMLREEMASNPDRLERFRREAQAVAALNHPNIVTIYSIEEAPEGHFMTMELVQGKGLDELVTGDGMSSERMMEIARPLIQALVAAHQRGITHRDLKPANVMMTKDGQVKVLDFGLAKLTAAADSGEHQDLPTQTLTQIGTVVGTIPYMSPEQVQGQAVDHRTDIFSLGVILYEMATGRKPFDGANSAEVASKILRDTPESIAVTRPDIPGELGRVIGRCLEKEPELRYQSAADILTALSSVGASGTRHKEDSGPSIAVLPFANMSPDKEQDYFCEGLAEELINALVVIEDLRVASRTSAFRFKGSEQDIREIGRRLGVSTVLEGSVRKAGNQVRIGVQLVDVENGYQLWSNRYDRELKDVFAIQDEIAQKIVEALQVTLSPTQESKAEKAAPADVEAYDYYLKGRKLFYEFRERSFELARQMFNSAIVVDQKYARAHAGVADCCSFLYMYFDSNEENLREAEAASRRAVEIDPDLAEARASRGVALSLSEDYEKADQEFRKAIELNPKLYDAHYFYGRALVAQARHEEAAKCFEEASKINPDDYQALKFLAQTYQKLGRRPHAAAALRKSVEASRKHIAFNPDDVRALYLGASGLVEMGEMEVAQEWIAKAVELDPDDALVLYNVACVYTQLVENDKALDCLERSLALASSSENLNWIENDPDLDPLRDDPRYQAMIDAARAKQ